MLPEEQVNLARMVGIIKVLIQKFSAVKPLGHDN